MDRKISMDRIQVMSRLYDTPEQLNEFYDECLRIAEDELSSDVDDLKQLEKIRTYVDAAKTRLRTEGESALETLQAPIVGMLPSGLLYQIGRDGKTCLLG